MRSSSLARASPSWRQPPPRRGSAAGAVVRHLRPPVGSLTSRPHLRPGADTDGYTVSIDGAAAQAIAVNATRHSDGWPWGSTPWSWPGSPATARWRPAPSRPSLTTPARRRPSASTWPARRPPGRSRSRRRRGSPPMRTDTRSSSTGVPAQPIGTSGTVSLRASRRQPHHRLGGLAANCAVDGDNPSPRGLGWGDGARGDLVTCSAPAAPPRAASASPPRPAAPIPTRGYAISLDGAGALAIGTSATLPLADLASGPHTVGSPGSAGTAAWTATTPRRDRVRRHVAPVVFAVTCTASRPPARSRSARHDRAEQDPMDTLHDRRRRTPSRSA